MTKSGRYTCGYITRQHPHKKQTTDEHYHPQSYNAGVIKQLNSSYKYDAGNRNECKDILSQASEMLWIPWYDNLKIRLKLQFNFSDKRITVGVTRWYVRSAEIKDLLNLCYHDIHLQNHKWELYHISLLPH